MEPDKEYSLEDFLRWDLHNLKSFLAKRGLSKSGTKSELAALAYSCFVMKKQPCDTFTDCIAQTFQDYQDLLLLPSGLVIPDPSSILEGWISEREDGMSFWPPVNIVDIADFFDTHEAYNQRTKLLTDYKAGKAFDYYKSEWLKEISYNSLMPPVHLFALFHEICQFPEFPAP